MSSSLVTNSNYLIDLNSGANTLSITGAVAISGNLSVTGNSTLSGNILSNSIQNGTSNVNIATANGNIIVTANTGNTWTFSTGGNLVFPSGLNISNESPNTRILTNTGRLRITATDNAHIQIGWQSNIAGTGPVAKIYANGIDTGQPSNVVIKTGSFAATTYDWVFGNTGNLAAPGNISTGGAVKTGSFVTGNIPTATGVGAGARAFVTDADSITFGNLYVGGAANAMPVWSNGTSWYVG
jgi:hypothetical protein